MAEERDVARLRRALESERRHQQTDALASLTDVAANDPGRVLDLVPLVATHLDDDSESVRRNATVTLGRIAEEYPDHVKPAVPHLADAVESNDVPVAAMAALGQVAKAYPAVAAPLVETFVERLDAGNHRIRNNALAGLADLADEYHDELHHYSTRYIELLEDDHERIRYNATSVLSRLAREYPEAVAPAIPRFRDLLTADHTWTRENACWALGHLRAETALPELEDVHDGDPDDRVRDVAEHAIERIRE